MALRIIDHNSDQYKDMVNLRMEILRRPLNLSFKNEDLEKEKEDILLGAFEEDKIIGCCVLTKLPEGICQLRQMAIHLGMQRNGLGSSLLNFAENVARDAGFSTMVMHARKTAVGFYEKLGYTIYGKEFEEVTLPHFEMRKFIILP